MYEGRRVWSIVGYSINIYILRVVFLAPVSECADVEAAGTQAVKERLETHVRNGVTKVLAFQRCHFK